MNLHADLEAAILATIESVLADYRIEASASVDVRVALCGHVDAEVVVEELVPCEPVNFAQCELVLGDD